MPESFTSPGATGPGRAPAVPWLDWGPEPFERARRERRPVLLSLTAAWCHGCGVMDRVTYADVDVATLIADHFVPVRVDADRRPDVYDRYHLEGLPTTVLLTPTGEMLTGTTYLPAQAMRDMLREVASAFASRFDELTARAEAAATARRAAAAPPDRGQPDLGAPAWIAEKIVADADPEHGGFGTEGKFLHLPALTAGLAVYAKTREPRLGDVLRLSIAALADGGVADAVEGGLFRYAAGRDWTKPHTEKLLEDQAAAAALFADASVVLDEPAFAGAARRVIAYVERVLRAPGDAGYFGSQEADEAYYQLGSADLRRGLGAPPVDRTIYTDTSAQTARAWLGASTVLADDGIARGAASALDRVVAATYSPGQGLAHTLDGRSGARGLLTDQVHAAAALLALHDATGNSTWSMLAEELMRFALRTMWDAAAGGFVDHAPGRAGDIGLLAHPLRPVATNALAARVLARLARLTGDADLQARAVDTLGAHAGTWRRQGLAGAPYALGVLEVMGA